MRKHVVCLGVLSIVALLLAGCGGAFLNEGSTRVRVALPPSPPAPLAFNAIYHKPRNQTAKAALIEKDSHFSISLLSAYICDFREARNIFTFFDDSNSTGGSKNLGCTYGGLRDLLSGKERITRGEIILVVNVGESSASKGLTINPADAENKGRVIYYNDDLRESGQLINAMNLPIYGPKKYDGKNLVFEMWMMELDNDENQQIKSLLGSLASIGGKAYPPSAPILAVLNNLGGAMLSGNSDDIEVRFQMRFDVPAPSGDTSKVARLALAEGYYAFVREENRDLNPEWKTFTVNEDLGVLCQAKAPPEGGCVEGDQNTYRDRTWFLVRIAKETASAALDLEYGERLGTFLNRIEQLEADQNTETEQALESLKASLGALVSEAETEE